MRKHKKARLVSMDELQARPCEVDGVPALFHRWVEDDQALLRVNVLSRETDAGRLHQIYQQASVLPGGGSVEVIRKTYALVEYQDGTVHMVAPELITFTDKEAKQ